MQVQNPGHYFDEQLKALDDRLDRALRSRKACRAFQILKSKMESDYRREEKRKRRQERRRCRNRENMMFFDTRNNSVSPETIRNKYKQIFNSIEYRTAVHSLLGKK
jgi:hypothetical protein